LSRTSFFEISIKNSRNSEWILSFFSGTWNLIVDSRNCQKIFKSLKPFFFGRRQKKTKKIISLPFGEVKKFLNKSAGANYTMHEFCLFFIGVENLNPLKMPRLSIFEKKNPFSKDWTGQKNPQKNKKIQEKILLSKKIFWKEFVKEVSQLSFMKTYFLRISKTWTQNYYLQTNVDFWKMSSIKIFILFELVQKRCTWEFLIKLLIFFVLRESIQVFFSSRIKVNLEGLSSQLSIIAKYFSNKSQENFQKKFSRRTTYFHHCQKLNLDILFLLLRHSQNFLFEEI